MQQSSFKKFLPLAILIACIAVVFASDLHHFFTFENLKKNREHLTLFTNQFPFIAPVIYITIYALSTSLSIPGATILTITGGFLFGNIFGTLYAVIGATLGATCIYFVSKIAFRDYFKEKAGKFISTLENGFKKNAFNYLLFLRLIPLFPFFIINIVPALLGVKPKVFVTATFIGIIPGAFVYSSVGSGLGSIFDQGQEFSTSSILTPDIIIALTGLAILALLPIIYKKITSKNKNKTPS